MTGYDQTILQDNFLRHVVGAGRSVCRWEELDFWERGAGERPKN